jgi:hypothetical protein
MLPAIGEKHLSPNAHQRAGRAKMPNNGRISAMGGKVLQKRRMEREDWFSANHGVHSVRITSPRNRISEGMEDMMPYPFKASDQEVIRTMIETTEDDVEANRVQFDRWLYTYDDLRFSSTLVCAEMKYKELMQVSRFAADDAQHVCFCSGIRPSMHTLVLFIHLTWIHAKNSLLVESRSQILCRQQDAV